MLLKAMRMSRGCCGQKGKTVNTTTELNEKDEPIALPVSLRDYFAAKAMEVDYTLAKNFTDPDWRYGIALEAYKMADAMLKARGQQ